MAHGKYGRLQLRPRRRCTTSRSAAAIAVTIAVTIAIASLTANTGRASTVVALSEQELVSRSAAIALGVVLATHAIQTPSGAVVTRAAVQVLKPLRGVEPGELITLQVPGGELADGRLVARTSGAPTLRPGELVFAFLERVARELRPIGLSYGLLQVRLDAKGDYFVHRNIAQLRLVDALGRSVPNDTPVTQEPLVHFLPRIEAMVAAAEQR